MLLNDWPPAGALDRDIKSYDDLAKEGFFTGSYRKRCLMEPSQLMKLFRHFHKSEIPRRTLQLYHSPRLQLLPPPVHRGGHISYYLNPEHTDRLAVVMHLRDKLKFSLQDIRAVMAAFPPEHYDLILSGILDGTDIKDFPIEKRRGFGVKDFVYKKIADLLEGVNNFTPEAEFRRGRDPEWESQRLVNRLLSRELEQVQKWLRTDRRHDMGFTDFTDKEWRKQLDERKTMDQKVKKLYAGRRR